MKKFIYGFAIGIVGLFAGAAVADITVLDGASASKVIKNFVCETTKLCNATVLIKSDGTEIGTVSNPVQVAIASSAAGTVAGTTSTSALGSMVNCAATTSPSGQTTGNQSYLNCVAGALLGQLRVTPSYGVNDAVGDPCQTATKTTVPFTLATAAVKVAITGVSAKKIYVCAWELNNNAADSIAIFEATTATVCVTAAAAIIGAGTSVATAATGYNFAANGGMARGNGASQVLATLTNAADLCIAQSAATQLSGSFTYVTQ